MTDLILFVHGLACAGASFDGAGAYPALGETWAPDLPGHGGRPVPEGCDGTMEALAEDLRAGLAARDYHRLHLVAHSMGAAPALLLADRGAEIRLASFVNIEGNLIGADCSLLSRRASAMPPRDFRAIHWPKLVTAASEARDPAVRTWAGWMAQADPAAVHAACGSLVAWSDGGELLARYRALAVPKVYVHGGTSALPEVLAALEGTPVQAFDGAGHFVPTAAPDRFYPWLADWLARLPKVQ
ncbi:MAG: alpha/beta fold hydrolase [Rhodobacterales bacterium]|nr:alpha/beta fold hydrolase [Rhodobacterales bacterium]